MVNKQFWLECRERNRPLRAWLATFAFTIGLGLAVPSEAAEIVASPTPPASSVPLSQASPTAPTLDLASLSRSTGEWPKTVILTEAVDFPVVMNSKAVGSVKLPRGSLAKLIRIEADGITLECQQLSRKVPVKATDLEERVLAARRGTSSSELQPKAASSLVVPSPTPASLPIQNGPARTSLAQGGSSPVAVAVTPLPVPLSVPSQSVAVQTSLERPTAQQLQAALERSGENRPELEKALAQSQGTAAKEMELLISSAPQYDLVNLTAKHLLNNVNYYQKARQAMPWAGSIPEPMWLEYVLPYRVADEDLDDWRPEFYTTLLPVVKEFHDTNKAARAIHQWLYKGDGGTARIQFKVSENRDQTPRQLLNQTKIGRCFEMNLLLVSLLRSAGIPARHAGVTYWATTEFYHYWVEYWDTESHKWLSLEPNANPDALMAKTTPFPVVYAFPGFFAERDPVGRERWDMMTNVTASYAKTGKLNVQCFPVARGVPVTFTVYSWSLSTWRSIATMQGDGQASFELAANEKLHPYLVSASVNDKIAWKFARVTADKTESVSLSPGAPQEDLVEAYKK